MSFDKDVLEELKSLLEMSRDEYEGIMTRWAEIGPISKFNLCDSEDFKIGFVFGKMESKFLSWFYSMHGCSMSDEEYFKFWDMMKSFSKNLNPN